MKKTLNPNNLFSRLLFVLALLFAVSNLQATTYSGTCGLHLNYRFNSDSATLTLTGRGSMENFTYNSGSTNLPPWKGFRSKIKKVVYEGTDSISIGSFAFAFCKNLETIDLPTTVIVQVGAFWGCKSLSTVILPKTTTMANAFNECSNLSTLVLPRVTSIGSSAFLGCSKLSTVVLGDVKNISSVAFSDCPISRLIILNTSEPTVDSTAFSSIDTLYYEWYYWNDNSSLKKSKNRVHITWEKKNPTCSQGYLPGYYSDDNSIYVTDSFEIKDASAGILQPIYDHAYTLDNGACSGCFSFPPAIDSDNDGFYEISNEGQLRWFSQFVSYGNTSANAILTNDIVMNSRYMTEEGTLNLKDTMLMLGILSDWDPIGTVNNPYSGYFNGKGHTIGGLFKSPWTLSTSDEYMGLFGYIGTGKVDSVGIVSSYVYVRQNCTGLVCAYNVGGTISNCYSSGSVICRTNCAAGGLCGYNGGTIINCYNTGSVYCESGEGGICGRSEGSIINCYNTGNMAHISSSSDGICSSNKGTLINCFSIIYYTSDNRFTSGEVAFHLQKYVDESGDATLANWGQKLGSDEYPVFSNDTVYQSTNCQGTFFTNNKLYSEKALGHNYQNGFCVNEKADGSKCDAYEQAILNNGVYEISNAGQLYWFASLVNDSTDGNKANAVLTADILVNDTAGWKSWPTNAPSRSWTPIGNGSSQYSGTFNGNGRVIRGLYFNNETSDYVGLFGYAGEGGKVNSVGVVASYFKGRNDVGSVCGYNSGTVNNCYNTGSVNGSSCVGGVCGFNVINGTVSNCYNTGSVYGGNEFFGGVCGNNDGGTVSNCYCSSETLVSSGPTTNCAIKTLEQFASGEVAYLLSHGDIDGSIWGQLINTDTIPVFSNNTVYKYTYCSGKTEYSNDESKSGVQDHDFPTEYTVDVQPTCTATGLQSKHCIRCDAKNDVTVVAALGHTWGEWDTTKVATCEDAGSRKHSCKNNATHKETEVIEALGHDYSAEYTVDKLPTCTETGSQSRHCTRCDATTDVTVLEALGHDYNANGFCSRCDGYQPATKNGDDVYEIANAGQLYWFASFVNDSTIGNSANAELIADIMVNDTAGWKSWATSAPTRSWTPIGNESKAYIGSFNGKGHTVSGLYFNNEETEFVGLFGVISEGFNDLYQYYPSNGSVNSVGVVASYFKGSDEIGGVCGSNKSGTISNSYSTGNVNGRIDVGGVCGQVMYGSVCNCYNTGSVNGSGDHTIVGGVCGHVSYGSVSNCYNTGSVTGSGDDVSVGGVSGSVFFGSVSNCYNTGSVTGSGDDVSVGGVSGSVYFGSFSNCFCTSENLVGSGSTTNCSTKTASQFASGEVALLLQKYVDESGDATLANWSQKFGDDMIPVFGSDGIEYVREKKSNRWGSLCLPYAISSANASFFTVAKKDGDMLILKPIDEVEAGKPVIYYCTDDSLKVTMADFGADALAKSPLNGDFLVGSYVVDTIAADNSFYLKDNKFYSCNGSFVVNPYKAYIQMSDENSANQVLRFNLNGHTTPVDAVAEEASATDGTSETVRIEAIYNIKGQRVAGMQKNGIYLLKMSDGTTQKAVVR